MLYEDNYLTHYGIKGQRWGLRRFQNEDGTLTEEGLRRYDASSEKLPKGLSKREKELTERYMLAGISKKKAQAQAKNRAKAEKIIKIAGAVALASAIAYGAYKGHKWLAKYGDKSVKKGSEIFRVKMNNTLSSDHAGYATDNVKDAIKYRGLYGEQIKRLRAQGIYPEGRTYQMTARATGKIRLAGERNASKVYEKLIRNDPEFVKANASVMREWNAKKGYSEAWRKLSPYQKFNSAALVDHETPGVKVVQNKFYNALKAKGYGGVVDINDIKSSGYHAKNAFVLFNFKDKIADVSIKEISDQTIKENAKKALSIVHNQRYIDRKVANIVKSVKSLSLYSSIFAVPGILGLKIQDAKLKRKASQNKQLVKQYKKDHPNTKLSDKQILKNRLGGDQI